MTLHTFRRPHYFLGKQLGVEDLEREQAYHRDKGRLRNRLLFGTGVVAGLRVSVQQDDLVISPGVAIDCQGNELVLAAEHRQALPAAGGRLFVAVAYKEVPVGAVPSPRGAPEPAWIEETVAVQVWPHPPACPASGTAMRLQGCDPAHPVCIGSLARTGTRWRVRHVRRARKGPTTHR